MFEKWNRALRKKLKDEEATKGDILERITYETFDEKEHSMLVKGSMAELAKEQEELVDLEQADLYDYIKIERKYGRTD